MHRGRPCTAARTTPLVTGALATGMLVIGMLVPGCASRQAPDPAQPSAAPPVTLPVTPPLTPAPLPLPRPQPPGGTSPAPGLDAEDQARLVEARRVGAPWVTLLVATEPARTEEVSAALVRLGGVLGTTGPGAGRLRLTMPTGQVARAAALPGVTAVDVEEVVNPRYPRPTG